MTTPNIGDIGDFDAADTDRLREIQEKNGFVAVWCVDSVPSHKLDEKAPPIKTLVMWEGSYKFEQPITPTWLELWRMVDSYVRTADPSHCFIESFNNEPGRPKNRVNVFLGS